MTKLPLRTGVPYRTRGGEKVILSDHDGKKWWGFIFRGGDIRCTASWHDDGEPDCGTYPRDVIVSEWVDPPEPFEAWIVSWYAYDCSPHVAAYHDREKALDHMKAFAEGLSDHGTFGLQRITLTPGLIEGEEG